MSSKSLVCPNSDDDQADCKVVTEQVPLTQVILPKAKSEGNIGLAGPIKRLANEQNGNKTSFRHSGYQFFDNFSDSENESTVLSDIQEPVITEDQEVEPENTQAISVFYSILILVVNVGFILAATFVFMIVENRGETKRNAEAYETLQHFEGHIDNATNILAELLTLQQQMCRKNNDRVGNDWVFWGSFQFCNTVITTLGYGLVYPHTAIAKYITMVYGLFGIPIYLCYIAYFTDYVLLGLDAIRCCIQRWTHWNWMVKSQIRIALMRSLFATICLFIYIAVHLWVVYPAERDWEEPHMKRSLMQMFYWQTIRFTTIGFGDIVVLLGHEIPKLMSSTLLGLPLGICCMNVYFSAIRSMSGTKMFQNSTVYEKLRSCCGRKQQ
ncbi:potassium channel subfamily K member 16-like [Bolinopsis microptera]|uniref:potassium channel subfamily K member 16-like n=1 Tax=Bolinopsis microptera TaxID=2820187 RepID=UPI0030790744